MDLATGKAVKHRARGARQGGRSRRAQPDSEAQGLRPRGRRLRQGPRDGRRAADHPHVRGGETGPSSSPAASASAFRRGNERLRLRPRRPASSPRPPTCGWRRTPPRRTSPRLLAEQQTRLFDVIRQQQEKEKREREEERANQKADPTRPPLPWYLGKDDHDRGLWPSPPPATGWPWSPPRSRSDSGQKPVEDAPATSPTSGNVETRDVRVQGGQPRSRSPTPSVLLDLATHKRHDLDLAVLPGIKEDPLKALREAAKAKREAAKKKSESEKDEAAKKDGDTQDEDKKKDDEKKDEKKTEEAKAPAGGDRRASPGPTTASGSRRGSAPATTRTAGSPPGTPPARHSPPATGSPMRPGSTGTSTSSAGCATTRPSGSSPRRAGYSQLYRLSTRTGETRASDAGGPLRGLRSRA